MLFSVSVAWAGEPPLGCYKRAYSEEEVGQNSSHIVAQIELEFFSYEVSFPELHAGGVFGANMDVRFADHGRLRGSENAGVTMYALVNCRGSEGKGYRCLPNDCDGSGQFMVFHGFDDELDIFTQFGFRLDGRATEMGCEPMEDIAPILGEPAAYRLERDYSNSCVPL